MTSYAVGGHMQENKRLPRFHKKPLRDAAESVMPWKTGLPRQETEKELSAS